MNILSNATFTKKISISAIKNFKKRIFGENNVVVQNKEPVTLLHITHWKAGSQWIKRILLDCAYDKVNKTEMKNSIILTTTLLPQQVYSALYISYEKFKLLNLPEKFTKFIIIRDLRDTLISFYYSMKISHRVVENATIIKSMREVLNKVSLEEGLILLMQNTLYKCANIQISWINAGEKLIKYEDLINNDAKILAPIISQSLLIPEDTVISSIEANRFETVTNGRKPGAEDIYSHQRKGIVGDWKNYFTENVKHEFKSRYGDLLIQTGYEKDFNW